MLKGLVKLEFVDSITGEITRVLEGENFIFRDSYLGLWNDSFVLQRPCIYNRNLDTYPMFDRNQNLYGYHQNFLTGYAPTGTTRKRFFPKTDDSDAYWDFYSLFLPPATNSIIRAIGLTSYNGDNIEYTSSPGNVSHTCINLDPPCYQSTTEYLNIYYRLIVTEDEESNSSDFVKLQSVYDIDRATSKVVFWDVNHILYPFRINHTLDKDDSINFVSYGYSSIANKSTTRPNAEHGRLTAVYKSYTYPDASPNQYTQLNYGLVNTVFRGAGANMRLTDIGSAHPTYGMHVNTAPVKITPEIDQNFTGLGNVFSSAQASLLTIFDAANFPAGSGRMRRAGVLDDLETVIPSIIQCEIKTEDTESNRATYSMREWKLIGAHRNTEQRIPLVLFPHGVGDINTRDDNGWMGVFKDLMYKEPNRVHCSRNLEVVKTGKSFVSWNETGVTYYDVFNGRIESFNEFSLPQLNVSKICDVRVDKTAGFIWIACENTGLWRLKITDTDFEMMHVGILSGAQQRCYGVDVDNYGNVYAVFYGTGLFLTTNYGMTWNNVPIDYEGFSGWDEVNERQKWVGLGRLICNPNRDARDGVGQLLLLMKSSVPDYALSGGCWYDFQSQITTGITNTTMKNSLAYVRDNRPNRDCIAISNTHDKWMFLNSDTTFNYNWCEFQRNSAMSAVNISVNSSSPLSMINIRNARNPDTLEIEEFLVSGWTNVKPYNEQNTICALFRVSDNSLKNYILTTDHNNNSGGNSGVSYGAKLFDDNIVLSYSSVRYAYTSQSNLGFFLTSRIPYIKGQSWWAANNYGWNGSQWVLNQLGNKPVHSTFEPLLRGAQNIFVDGPVATPSWITGDIFTFTAFNGYFKDNSSTMNLRDSHYLLPSEVITDFSPSVVTRIHREDQAGVVNASPIEIDWNIDDIPDTTYSGGLLVLDGDLYYPNVVYLAKFDENLDADKGAHDVVNGFPTLSEDQTIFGGTGMVYVDGQSGFFMNPSASLTLSSTFTIEMTVILESTGNKMYLMDFRSSGTQAGGFYITENGRLGVEINNVTYGNVGDLFLFPGTEYRICFTRDANNDWRCYVNGSLQWTFNNTATIVNNASMHVFRKYIATNAEVGYEGLVGWAGNVRITRNMVREEKDTSAYFPNTQNVYDGAGMVLSGNYAAGSIVCKRELVGDWQVTFANVNNDNGGSWRNRPKLGFGISINKHIETPVDISYRILGKRPAIFNETWTQNAEIPTNAVAVRFTKTGNYINGDYTTNGYSWTRITRFNQLEDHNPLHHIVFWQVQPSQDAMIIPTVVINYNGNAIFSRIGSSAKRNGYYHPRFWAMDSYSSREVKINLDGVPVTNVRSHWSSTLENPAQSEVKALQGGTIVFNHEDIGKEITGSCVAMRN